MNLNEAVEKATPILSKVMGTTDTWEYKGVCSFGFLSDGWQRAYHHQACHAAVNDIQLGDDKWFYSTVTVEDNSHRKNDVLEYTQWALSDESPWKSLFEGRERVVLEDKGSVLGYLFPVKPTDSRSLLNNLCMGIRFCSEHEGFFEAHLDFMELGLSRVDAFYLGQYFQRTGRDAVASGGVDNSNHIIAPEPLDFNIKRFEEGRPYSWGKDLSGKRLPQQDKTNKLVEYNWSYITTVFRNEDLKSKLKPIYKKKFEEESLNGRWSKFKFTRTASVADYYINEYKPKYMEELEKVA